MISISGHFQNRLSDSQAVVSSSARILGSPTSGVGSRLGYSFTSESSCVEPAAQATWTVADPWPALLCACSSSEQLQSDVSWQPTGTRASES
mmetsp:Transcript_49380/g.77162  ORF Transcript_49380/g.77162 Transcript_49380/m.77162 type:complete len:92 (-) Transcript_49380:486-761(-)